VAHLASVVNFAPDPNTVIPQTVAGAVNALKAAAKEPSVKRVVLTSSSTAATLPKPDKAFSIDEKTWNEEAIKLAWAPPPYEPSRGYTVYAASKTEAEQAAWKFVQDNKPGFVLNTILPNANFGEILDQKNQSASTGDIPRQLFRGDMAGTSLVPPQWFVNVKDAARLHISGLINPSVENERIYAFAAPFNWNDVLAILRELYPDRKFPEDIPNEPRDLCKVPNQRGAELLKHDFGRPGWTSLKETIKENTQGL